MENQHENLPLIEDNFESESGESKSCCLSMALSLGLGLSWLREGTGREWPAIKIREHQAEPRTEKSLKRDGLRPRAPCLPHAKHPSAMAA